MDTTDTEKPKKKPTRLKRPRKTKNGKYIGRPPKDYHDRVPFVLSIRVSPTTKRCLELLAKGYDLTTSQFCAKVLGEYLDHVRNFDPTADD